MKHEPVGAMPLKLELVEEVPPAVTPAPEASIEIQSVEATPHPSAPAVDPFVAQATRERERGVVDAALWGKALALAGGDAAAAVAPYLRARATMLRLAHARKAGRPLRPAPPPLAADPDERPSPPRRLAPSLRGKPLAFTASVVGLVAAAAVAWMLLAPEAGPPAAAPVARPAAEKAAPATVAKAAAPTPEQVGAELAARVAQLKQAGNWNVLVLVANEWTRKEPGNANAWSELSAGYMKLRQVDEALDAVRTALQLDPKSALHLRRLADVYVALERPADAVAATELALGQDGGSADGHAEAGRLYLQLARVNEAKAAFERALALDPAHVRASCGRLDVARAQGRGRDVEALATALRSANIACPETLAVAALSAPVAKPAPAAKR